MGEAVKSYSDCDEAFETLVFLDWDDSLFPATELFERRGLCIECPTISDQLDKELETWRHALYDYLSVARSVSGHCVILTSATRPWVSLCVKHFAPNLENLIHDGPQGISVIYANEAPLSRVQKWREKHNIGHLSADDSFPDEDAKLEARCTEAKCASMAKVAAAFYSKHPLQTWKNLVSEGDMPFEHNALKEVAFVIKSDIDKHVRTKTLRLSSSPSLAEITLRLQFSRLLLPAYVRFPGDIDLDLAQCTDPWEAIAQALDIPQLGCRNLPACCWGRSLPRSNTCAIEALDELAKLLHSADPWSLSSQQDAKTAAITIEGPI